MSLLFLFLFCLLGTQAVHAKQSSFQFTMADVRQCEPVFLNFSAGPQKAGAATSLKLLPFNSTAFDIPIPAVNVTDSGVNVSFLPLPVGTFFISSLDDDTGENTAKISDVTRVQAGPGSACLSNARNATTRLFTLPDQDVPEKQPRQCEDFTVKYNASMTGAPTVRIYSPQSAAYTLNKTADDNQGNAKYTMLAGRRAQYVLLFENNMGVQETTPLLTVGGDSSSSVACFGDLSSIAQGNAKNTNGGLPQKTIIGLAIGGGIVAIIALIMVAYLVWDRRRRRRVSIRFDPSMMEKRPESTTRGTISTPRGGNSIYTEYSSAGAGFVRNPPYTVSVRPRSPETLNTSSGQSTPLAFLSRQNTQQQKHRSSSDPSLQSFDDIEEILNSQEQRLNQDTYIPDPPLSAQSLESANLTVPAVAIRGIPTRGHLRDPSDVPRAPSNASSTALAYQSRESENPFNDSSNSLLAPFDPQNLKPPEIKKSHFSEVSTTSSFGFDGPGSARFNSGVPVSVSGDDVDEIPEVPRRPLPSASGLGRGNGEPR